MSEENLSAKDVEAARSFATIRNDQFLGTAPNPSWEAERKAFLAGISHARAQMEGSKGEWTRDTLYERFEQLDAELAELKARIMLTDMEQRFIDDLNAGKNVIFPGSIEKDLLKILNRLTAKPDEES